MSSRDTVLVIGAGASFGARPGTNRPPRGSELAAYLLRWFDANAPRERDHAWTVAMANEFDDSAPTRDLFDTDVDVRSILVRAAKRAQHSDTAFEEVMGDLLRGQKRAALDRTNEIIAWAFLAGRECAFPEATDGYDRLLAALRGRLRTVVTPNYDLLIEEALDRAGATYRYLGVANEPSSADVGVAKFHGSINLFQASGVAGSASLEVARQMVRPLKAVPQTWGPSFYNDHPLYVPPSPRRRNTVLELKQSQGTPVLVTYGPGKDAMHGRPGLDAIRAACADDLTRTPARILAVGISPPRGHGDDDTWDALCSRIAGTLCTKEYWSMDRQQRERMSLYGFVGRNGWLDDLIADL